MRIVLAIINFIALIGAVIWLLTSPGWEPSITSLVLLGALLAQIFTSEEMKSKLKFVQNTKNGAHSYQAARDQTNTDQKVTQKGGKNSQQMQANEMHVHIGVDEKRAREICQEISLQLRKDYSQEALDIANLRVTEFENSLMPKMEQVNGALEAFADPGFQLLLVEAQRTAAATERSADYDLLSELLIHRFQKGEDRAIRAGISRAVEIVDKISDEALLGLTASHAVSAFFPISGDMHEGLNVLEVMFSKIIYGKLPVEGEWLDHLDILDAVRISSLGNFKKIQQFYPETLAGYVDVGIEKGSDDHENAAGIIKNSKLPKNILVDHVLNDNFVRVDISNINLIDSLALKRQISHGGNVITVPTLLSNEQQSAINSIYSLYKNDGDIKQQNISIFMEEWDKRPTLKILREWWDSINPSFQITSVGKVLAHSNAQRCDKNLPPLN